METTSVTLQSSADFANRLHFWGRMTIFMALIAFMAVPVGLSILYDVPLQWGQTFATAIPILVTFTIAGMCEILSFTPVVGAGAVYLSCLTGNLSNMKVPASINAMDLADCTPGSEKGDVISMIAVSASTFVTTGIVFLGMIFLAPIFEPIYNNPFLKPAFVNLLPSLFGALLLPYMLKNKKECIVPIVVPAIIILLIGRSQFSSLQSYIMIGIILLSVLYSYLLHKKEFDAAKKQGE